MRSGWRTVREKARAPNSTYHCFVLHITNTLCIMETMATGPGTATQGGREQHTYLLHMTASTHITAKCISDTDKMEDGPVS